MFAARQSKRYLVAHEAVDSFALAQALARFYSTKLGYNVLVIDSI